MILKKLFEKCEHRKLENKRNQAFIKGKDRIIRRRDRLLKHHFELEKFDSQKYFHLRKKMKLLTNSTV